MTKQAEAIVTLLQEERGRKITREGLTRVNHALNVLDLPFEDCNSITAALGYTPGLFEGLS